MKCAIRSQNWPWFPCFAHTMNLAVQAGLQAPGVSDLLDVAKQLVSHFKHSSIAHAKLKDTAIQLTLEDDSIGNCKTLIQEVATRWNSCYYMLNRLLRLKKAILVIAADSYLKIPTAAQWKGIEDLRKVLEPLTVISDALGGDQYPTMSQVYPTVMEILQTKVKVNEDVDSTIVQNFKETMRDNTSENFLDDTQYDLIEICAFLDPR